ncbi:MAG: type II secretion system GspH family protein [Clostridia bacterium]|nr:type II secretion system GspH family protein [Clostridia bacterium]
MRSLNFYKNEKGGFKVMDSKKVLKSNKGFSLVELMIVLGILAIIAVISIVAFGNVLDNSRLKADMQQAQNIEKAIQTYISETDDWDLSGLGVADGDDTADAITALVNGVTLDVDGDGAVDDPCGPYLEDPDGNATIPAQGPGNVGFALAVNAADQTVTCRPVNADPLIDIT